MATPKLRILFHPQSTGVHTPNLNIRKINGLPHHSGRQLSNAYDYAGHLTNNHGNLVHYESVCRFLDLDEANSCRANLNQIYKQFGSDPEKFSDFIDSNFDHVVISSINFITNTKPDNTDFANMAEVITALKTPFSIFGVGIQEPPSKDDMRSLPSMARYLEVLNEQAQIFSCRGEVTSQWCHDHGYTKATASGCPSMYLFPDAVSRCTENAQRLDEDSSTWQYASAGKIHRKYRRSALFRCFERNENIDYFFQDELKLLIGEEQPDRLDVFAPSTSQLNVAKVQKLAKAHCDRKINLPFRRLFFCASPDAWRQQVSNSDVYIGDRLHGGIICIQAGVPSIFLSDDSRVSEVADFFGLPCFMVREVAANPALVKDTKNRDFLAQTYATAMEKYEQRLVEFKTLLTGAGLTYRSL